MPTTISAELESNIARKPLVGPPPSLEVLNTGIAQLDAEYGDMAQKLWAALDLAVEEVVIAGVRCYTLTPKNARTDRLLIHAHGGAYILFGGPSATMEATWIANATRTRVISIDYRRPPKYPSPAAVDDVVAVWDEVVVKQQQGNTVPPSRVGLLGGSAGGGLVMASLIKLAELGKPGPAALLVHSPWTDISKTGDSYIINEMVDNILGRYEGALSKAAELYADGQDLKHPYLSPVYGDLSSYPPTAIFTGTRDLFLSNAVRAHRKLRRAGIEAQLHVFEGLSHCEWQPTMKVLDLVHNLPLEMEDALEETVLFFDRYLGGSISSSSSSSSVDNELG